MQLAVNWSPEAAELFREGAVNFDIYKCSPWNELVEPANQQLRAYVHFEVTLGTGQHDKWDFAEIEGWLKRTDTLVINSHIVPQRAQFGDDIAVDDLTAALIAEVQKLVDHFGPERVIIENAPYQPRNMAKGYLIQGGEPALFQAITSETGCGFLLDVAHARLTSQTTGADFKAYIAALPVHRLRELHITGLGTRPDGSFGDHMPMRDDDWPAAEWAFDQIRTGAWRTPDTMAFEYGGIGRLRERCGSERAAIAVALPRFQHLIDTSVPT